MRSGTWTGTSEEYLVSSHINRPQISFAVLRNIFLPPLNVNKNFIGGMFKETRFTKSGLRKTRVLLVTHKFDLFSSAHRIIMVRNVKLREPRNCL